MRHQPGQLVPEAHLPDGGLDADRQPGLGGEQLDEVEQAVLVGERGVPRRAGAVLAHRDAADLGDLLGHLRRGQQPAEAGLGALGELDLDRPHRRGVDDLLEPARARSCPCSSRQPKYAVPICSTMSPPWRWYGESPPSPVLCRQPASGRAPVEGLIGVAGHRAEAHRGDVDQRRRAGTPWPGPRGPPSTLALGSPAVAAWSCGQRRREGAVLDDRVARQVLDVVVGAEPGVVVLLLGRGVDPGALVAAERPLLVVAGDDVLAQLRTDRLQPVARVRDHRVVAQQRVPLLGQVARRDRPTPRRQPDPADAPADELHEACPTPWPAAVSMQRTAARRCVPDRRAGNLRPWT